MVLQVHAPLSGSHCMCRFCLFEVNGRKFESLREKDAYFRAIIEEKENGWCLACCHPWLAMVLGHASRSHSSHPNCMALGH